MDLITQKSCVNKLMNYYANGTLVSTVDGTGSTSASVFHNHQDHLGSTAAVTSNIGYMTRLYNYYPYGSLRLDEGSASTTFAQPNQFIGQDRDKEADLSYLNARYYSSNQGQFTSQDPVFWSESQDLKNPQNFNSYSYGTDNPIGKKDPDGKAAYIWDNGAGMSGIDTSDKNTYYQFQDTAILQNNAAEMRTPENYGNYSSFYNNVKNGAKWDYKNLNRAMYFFGDELISSQSFGNRNYGYAGTAAGFGKVTLKAAAGYAQVRAGTAEIKNVRTYFDDPKDTKNIQKGINSYNSNKSSSNNNSKNYSSATSNLSAAQKAIAQGDYNSAYRLISNAGKSIGKVK